MKKLILGVAFCLIAGFASAQTTEKPTTFGTGVNGDAAPIGKMEKMLGDKNSAEMQVKGKVLEVCQKKGCWMTLQMPDGQDPIRVTFKDYAFFMPMDIVGKEVALDGLAKKQVISVETLRHYAEDAHKSDAEIAKITEPKKELAFEAKGVKILTGSK